MLSVTVYFNCLLTFWQPSWCLSSVSLSDVANPRNWPHSLQHFALHMLSPLLAVLHPAAQCCQTCSQIDYIFCVLQLCTRNLLTTSVTNCLQPRTVDDWLSTNACFVFYMHSACLTASPLASQPSYIFTSVHHSLTTVAIYHHFVKLILLTMPLNTHFSITTYAQALLTVHTSRWSMHKSCLLNDTKV